MNAFAVDLDEALNQLEQEEEEFKSKKIKSNLTWPNKKRPSKNFQFSIIKTSMHAWSHQQHLIKILARVKMKTEKKNQVTKKSRMRKSLSWAMSKS